MTRITGHRGARNLWAENSATGFREAARLGCDAIEFDVHLTDAGELVVIHDATLERTTDGAGEVRALSPRARAATKLKDSADTIPTLDEVLDILAPVEGLRLHVEIKVDARENPYPGIAGRVAERLVLHGLEARSHLTSFDLEVLRDCREQAPRIARLVSADGERVARRGGLGGFFAEVGDLVDVVALRHDFLADHFDAVCALWPAERLGAWTVNAPDEMEAWLARRVGNLTSDRPDLALELRQRAAA